MILLIVSQQKRHSGSFSTFHPAAVFLCRKSGIKKIQIKGHPLQVKLIIVSSRSKTTYGFYSCHKLLWAGCLQIICYKLGWFSIVVMLHFHIHSLSILTYIYTDFQPTNSCQQHFF